MVHDRLIIQCHSKSPHIISVKILRFPQHLVPPQRRHIAQVVHHIRHRGHDGVHLLHRYCPRTGSAAASRGRSRGCAPEPAAHGWGPRSPTCSAEPEEAQMPFLSSRSSKALALDALKAETGRSPAAGAPGRRSGRNGGCLESPAISRSRMAATLRGVLVHDARRRLPAPPPSRRSRPGSPSRPACPAPGRRR